MKISIIVPCYNAEKYIEKTLQSIRANNATIELIIIDGGSSDRTIEIAKKYQPDVLISERDKGQSDAINKGMAFATGSILAWQNADDVYEPNALEFVSDFFTKNSSVSVVYGDYKLIDADGGILSQATAPAWSNWKLRAGRFVPMQPTAFWRKDVWNRSGPASLGLRYCMDVDFFSAALADGFVFMHAGRCLGSFRMHEGSLTASRTPRLVIANEHLAVLKRRLDLRWWEIAAFWFFQVRGAVARRTRTGSW